MLIKILGVLDIVSAIVFLIETFTKSLLFPRAIIIAFAIYLIIKGLFFLVFLDFASVLDILCGIILFLVLFFSIPKLLVMVVFLYLFVKGIWSLLG